MLEAVVAVLLEEGRLDYLPAELAGSGFALYFEFHVGRGGVGEDAELGVGFEGAFFGGLSILQ